jgi:hypothetical protein
LLFVALTSWACDNGPSTAPTPTPGNPVTETFSGTLTLNGAVTYPFTVAGAGAVTATVTSVDPSGSVIGMQMGTWDTVTCTAVVSNSLASTASVLTANTSSSANLCLRVHDPNGVLTANPVNYTVTVVHY